MLPRLLYIADVPVENSLHGSALLYRLLLDYPRDRLRIVETGAQQSLPHRRLPGVDYRHVPQRMGRLRRTRLAKLVDSVAMVGAAHVSRAIRTATIGFDADAVLTVTNGNGWLSAVAFARAQKLPYHLICHDEWAGGGATLAALAAMKERIFAQAYRGAASRLCVSPAMGAAYQRRYGVAGETLYPARSPHGQVYEGLSPRLAAGACGRVVAFAGSMSTLAMVEANRRMAQAIAPLGGRLIIYGPATVEAHPSLAQPNIELRGLLPPDALVAALRNDVDILYLPMWFGPGEKVNERLSFPSKLTDYTNVGLPIFVSGDADCAAAVWERDHPGVALVQHSTAIPDIAADMQKLFEDRQLARSLAERAKAVGDIMFAATTAEQSFYRTLTHRS